MLRKGWTMQGTSEKITICKGKIELEFNIKIQTAKGVLYGFKIFNRNKFCGIAGNSTKTKINIMKAHTKLGRIGTQGRAIFNQANIPKNSGISFGEKPL
jgi:hypothetical protein